MQVLLRQFFQTPTIRALAKVIRHSDKRMSGHSGQEDMVIGSPVAGRAHGDLASILGMFVNTLTIRQRPNGEKPFSHFLQEVKEGVLAAQKHQDYPLSVGESLATQLQHEPPSPV